MQRFLMVALAAACGGEETRADVILGLTGDVANGETLYGTNCALCHGTAGEGVENLGAALAGATLSDEEVVNVLLNGNDEGMTPFDLLTDQELADVTAFVQSL